MLGLRYVERWGAAEELLAGLLDIAVLRPLPSMAITTNAVVVEELLGVPFQLHWEGVTLDAALRVAEPLARGDDAEAGRDWMRLAALAGSELEARLFEDELLVESLSADEGLARTRQAGAEVLVLEGVGDPQITLLDAHPTWVREDIEVWLFRGMRVEIPTDLVQHEAWQGSTYRVEDPTTGAAGYFLSGGLAGGTTVIPPGDWLLGFLADALAAAYSSAPNDDPLSAAVVEVLPYEPFGTVGEEVDRPLMVMVRDAEGRPVKGAAVEFSTTSVEGRLLDDSGAETTALNAVTDELGVAVASFRHGLHTESDPIFLKKSEDEAHLWRALQQFVEVVVDSHGGAVRPAQPFRLIAFPDEPASLHNASGNGFSIASVAGIYAGDYGFELHDQHGNSISNEMLEFRSIGFEDAGEACRNQRPESIQKGAVIDWDQCTVEVPALGECGAETVEKLTGYAGAAVGVIPGNDFAASYQFEVVWNGEPVHRAEFGLGVLHERINDRCEVSHPVYFVPEGMLTYQGRNINAAEVGSEFAAPIRAQLVSFQLDREWDIQPYDGNPGTPPGAVHGPLVVRHQRLTSGEAKPATGNGVDVYLPDGGALLRLEEVETGLFEATLAVGTLPALYPVRAKVESAEVLEEGYFCDLECPGDWDNGSCGIESPVLCYDLVWDERPTLVETSFPPLRDQRISEIFGVDLQSIEMSPEIATLNDSSRLEMDLVIRWSLLPEDYRPALAAVDLYRDGEAWQRYVAAEAGPAFEVAIPRGTRLDRERTYELRAVLNPDSVAEVLGVAVPLPLEQRLIRHHDASLSVSREVDVVNERVCDAPSAFSFGVNQPVNVSLTARPIEAVDTDGNFDLGSGISLLTDEPYDEGDHSVAFTPDDLPPGEYQLELRALSPIDGQEETKTAVAWSGYTSRESLPVGAVMEKDVNLWSGELVVSRQDLSIAARGRPLDFRRTYTGGGLDDEGGPLGLGWSHSWDSRILVTPCGEAIVQGGDGSGMRFVDDGAGGLRPLRGYHGTLLANPDFSFDFYSKSGQRFHYWKGPENVWHLGYVEDPSGNMTQLHYLEGAVEPRVAAIEDEAGRRLELTYARGTFTTWQGDVITQVDGPEGFSMTFSYDAEGYLTGARREPHEEGGAASWSESYRYEAQPGSPYALQKALVEIQDDVSGALTGFQWRYGTLPSEGDLALPRLLVAGVDPPEDDATTFHYGWDDDVARDGALTEVTDARGEATTYRFNLFGNAVEIVDAEGGTTTMEWSPTDALLTSRTDANGNTTAFTYDGDGNVLTETAELLDGSVAVELVRSWTYVPSSSFDPPYLKDRVATQTDRDGHVRQFSYDGKGRLMSEQISVLPLSGAARDERIEHTYAENGDRLTTVDARGERTRFRYDAYGNVIEVEDALGGVTATAWDARSRATSRTDALGQTTSFEHDALDRVVRTIHPDGEEQRMLYLDAASERQAIDAEGRTTATRYDLQGRPIEIVDAEGGRKVFAYGPAGHKTLESSWFDDETTRDDVTFEVDGVGRVVRRAEPLGRTTLYAYDPAGNLVREELQGESAPGFAPRVTETRYDELHRPIEVRRQLDASTWVVSSSEYDGEGRSVARVDAEGRRDELRYDAQGRLLEVVESVDSGASRTTQRAYDPAGNLVRETVLDAPADRVRTWEIDALGRIVVATDPEGGEASFEYDAVGNLVREIDPRLVATEHVFDARNRRVQTSLDLVGPDGVETSVTEWVYDGVGNVVEEHLPNGSVVAHVYDGLDRRISSSDPLGALGSQSYDARGRMSSSTDANGNVTLFAYDALDRLVGEDRPEGRTTLTSYDVAGNVVSVTDPRGHETLFEYDGLDRRVRQVDDLSPDDLLAPFEMTTAYDLVGNRTSETDRLGRATGFVYDALDRVVERADPALDTTVYRTTFSYDAMGNLLAETDRRGIVTEHDYDRAGRRTETRRAGQVVERLEYDAAGNLIFQEDANGNVTGFEVDERGLVTAENRPLAAITRTSYDAIGNRVEVRDPEGRLTQWTYDLRRRPVEETRAAHAVPETTVTTYDGNGNRIGVTRPEGNAWSYEVDAADRLVAVVDPTTARTEYVYDASDQLVGQRDALLAETSFEYDPLGRRTRVELADGSETLAEYDAVGNVTRERDAMGRWTSYAYDGWDRLVSSTLPSDASTTDDLLTRAQSWDPNNNLLTVEESFAETGPHDDHAHL